jgi:adenylate cyclase
MADIFLSYSRQDKARATALVAALEVEGWSVWWDPDITPGQEFDALITQQLEASRSLIVIWTPNSVDSRWVRGEARDAADRGVLVPVRYDNAKLPIDFRAVHTTDLDGWSEDRQSAPFRSLCKALEAILGAPKKPAAAASVAPKKPDVSICVVPFANMSGDPEQDYFSDGITEDIITDLGKVSSLSIVSRNMAFSFKGATGGVADIGRQTGSTHVLAGSVRKAGARVRITAQLINAANETQVWGERYDRDLNDIFALQDEISKAIVAALKLTLLPEEKRALESRSTTNADAYELYLMARQFWFIDNERNNEIVIRICRHVVEIDPNYAEAWATMALAQWNLFWKSELVYKDLEFAARRAMELGPNLSDSHVAVAAAYRSQGDFEKGLAACVKALEIDPRSYVANRMAGLCLTGLRRYDEAVKRLELAADLMETDFTAASFVPQCYEALGDKPKALGASKRALARIEKVIAADPGHGRAIGLGAGLLATLGERERAKKWARRASLIDPENMNLKYNLGCAMSVLGENDFAVELLQDVAERATTGMLSWMAADSDLDGLRSDSRFKAMIEKSKSRIAKQEA